MSKPCLTAVCLLLISMIVTVVAYNIKIEALSADLDELQNMVNEAGTSFTFEWAPYDQKIVNETLRMNLKFEAIEQKLFIIATINDDEYNERDFLGLAFDRNNDGNLEGEDVMILYADNTTISALLGNNGTLLIPLLHPEPSRVHTCVFKADIGYTFSATLVNTFPSDLTYICFRDKSEYVHIQFHIGMSW